MIKKMPKVSVIIPVYNAEEYLKGCLDSVVTQTLKNIEIICINDGSTDFSSNILDEYVKKDNRIKVIHKSNTGYGSSMNLGLEEANGDYISIIEPDDFADHTMLDELYQIATQENADVVKSNYYAYNTLQNKSIPNNSIKHKEVITFKNKNILKLLKHGPTIWTGLYKRDFLNQNQIRFLNTPGASYQDLGFNFKVLAMAEKIVLSPKTYYHYRTDNASSSVKNPNKVFCVCDEFTEIEKYLKEQNCYNEFKHILPNAKYTNYMWNYKRLPFKAKILFLKKFREDFMRYKKEGLVNKKTMGQKKYKRILCIITSPMLFNLLYSIEHIPLKLARSLSKIKGN